jgi:hypothetical protein
VVQREYHFTIPPFELINSQLQPAARYHENPEFQVPPLTLRRSMRSLKLRLWDEKNRRMVGFGGWQPG